LEVNQKVAQRPTYTLSQNNEQYSFEVYAEAKGFYYTGTALRISNTKDADGKKGYITTPAISNYKLTGVEITLTNNTTANKSVTLYSSCDVNEGVISYSGKIGDTMKISVVQDDVTSKTGSFAISGTEVNKQYFLYTASSGYQIGKLVLTYTKAN